jgi:hypothetical protein
VTVKIGTLRASSTDFARAASTYAASRFVSVERVSALRNQRSDVAVRSSSSLHRPRFSIVPAASGSRRIDCSNFAHACAGWCASISARPSSNATTAGGFSAGGGAGCSGWGCSGAGCAAAAVGPRAHAAITMRDARMSPHSTVYGFPKVDQRRVG